MHELTKSDLSSVHSEIINKCSQIKRVKNDKGKTETHKKILSLLSQPCSERKDKTRGNMQVLAS